MLKFLYKIVGLLYTSFIIFIFFVNYNFLSYKEGFILRAYYSVKINFIYYLFYILYVFIYIKYFKFRKVKNT